MINSFIRIFLPKDRIFYDLFEQVANNVLEAGKAFQAMIYETDASKRSACFLNVERIEHANDDLTHKLFTELGKNFITPFDREDIHALAVALDDIVDYVFASSKKINLYKVNPTDVGFHKLSELIEKATQQVHIAVMQLRHMKKLKTMTDALIKINTVENQADDVFDMSVERLFEMETNAIEVIKKKEIYQAMEVVTDKCEEAGNVIESILIKYA